MMDAEDRLELIALLAQDNAWKTIKKIGHAILDAYYPEDVFSGVSGDSGPKYIVALREALRRIEDNHTAEP